MIRKIHHAVTRTDAPKAVYDRFRTADDMLGTRFSPHEIVFPVGLHFEYLPYDEVKWAYIHTEEHRVTMGCCAGTITENRIMLIGHSGSITAVPFDRLGYAEHALKLIGQAAPNIAIGFNAENRARFGVAEPAV